MDGFADSGPGAQSLLDALGDAVVVTSGSGTIVAANRACEALFGYDPTELVGEKVEILLPERYRDGHVAHRGVYARRPWTRPMGIGTELAACRKDGGEFPVEVSLAPLPEGDELSVIACIRPLPDSPAGTSVKEAAARASVLVELSWTLAGGDPAAFDLVCVRTVEHLGDLCTITVRVPGEDDRLDPVAVYHPDPRVVATVVELLEANPLRLGEGVSGRVVESGEAAVVSGGGVLDRLQPEHRDVAERLGLHDALVAPLPAAGRAMGTISVGRLGAGPPYTDDDRVFLEAVAATVARTLPLAGPGAERRDRSGTFRRLAVNAADVIYRLRVWPQSDVEYVSPAIERMSGYTPADLYADADLLERIAHFEDRAKVRDLTRHPPADETSFKVRWVRRDRSVIWTEHRVTPARDETGRVVTLDGVARDVTASVALEEALAHQATHDPLTGLANRRLFFDRLEQSLGRLQRRRGAVAVLLVDLDHFKDVNDAWGHPAGDDVLVAMADRLRTAVRPADTVARLGGDEFGLVLEVDRSADAIDVAERVMEKCSQPVRGRGETVTASIGITAVADGEATAGEMVGHADVALYRAKGLGGGRWQMYDRTSA